MLSSAKTLDIQINELAEAVRQKMSAIEKPEKAFKSSTLRTLTKQLSALYKKMADTYSHYAHEEQNNKEKIFALNMAKDHYQFAIDELNKFNLTPQLYLYIVLLQTLDQLLVDDNLYADLYAKKMLVVFKEIQEKNLLELPHQHHIFIDEQKSMSLFELAMQTLPTYFGHALEESEIAQTQSEHKRKLFDDAHAYDEQHVDAFAKQPRMDDDAETITPTTTVLISEENSEDEIDLPDSHEEKQQQEEAPSPFSNPALLFTHPSSFLPKFSDAERERFFNSHKR